MRRWAATAGREVGAIVPLQQLWKLARLWYADRLAPDWRSRTAAESQAIFEEVGLTDAFWRLTP